jgi:peroxiredoxin
MFTAPPRSALTREFGPPLGITAPEFVARDHAGKPHHLDDLMGEKGLILGFIGDIWHEASVQRILWLARHAHSFIHQGFKVALVSGDQPHMLYGFFISSPIPPQFPLLTDVNGAIHQQFNMNAQAGLVLLDHNRVIRHKWLVPDERVWPNIHEVQEVLADLQD